MKHQIIIGIGSNTAPQRNIDRAKEELELHFEDISWSPFIPTEAIGFDGPPFVNGLSEASTSLTEPEVHLILKEIESRLGSHHADKRAGKVVIDLDLMAFDGQKRHERNWQFPFQQQLLEALHGAKNKNNSCL
ncbi:2-amino-4-hydroxy-6-hydroxymethyldihydropteridine diphosphokinase [Prevotella sp.]|uniref:2-amino-4-hydroxy-6- hydroxymethyldihydropteridine diphosphokinase n=1 Tax=Prevotella sp. TaxID=59823 RepID=UPI002F95421A